MNYKCDRVSTEYGRFYRSPSTGLWYPSVTTVVNHKNKAFFEEWRKNPENQLISKQALDSGQQLHTNMENYLAGKEPEFRNDVDADHFLNMQHVKNHITNIVCQEEVLYSDELRMAGQVDLIANYNGILSIIDYKTSRKPKRREWIHHYFDQTFCYAVMSEERLNIIPKQLVVIISTPGNGQAETFIERTRDVAKHCVTTIQDYWKIHNFIQIQNICEEKYHRS